MPFLCNALELTTIPTPRDLVMHHHKGHPVRMPFSCNALELTPNTYQEFGDASVSAMDVTDASVLDVMHHL